MLRRHPAERREMLAMKQFIDALRVDESLAPAHQFRWLCIVYAQTYPAR
jgi:hypothetical protein